MVRLTGTISDGLDEQIRIIVLISNFGKLLDRILFSSWSLRRADRSWSIKQRGFDRQEWRGELWGRERRVHQIRIGEVFRMKDSLRREIVQLPDRESVSGPE